MIKTHYKVRIKQKIRDSLPAKFNLGRVLQRKSKQGLSINLCLSRPIVPSREILDCDELHLSNVALTLCSWIMVQYHYT